MKLATIQTSNPPYHAEFAKKANELNLVYYASEAASKMGFENLIEFNDAVKRTMELCICAGIPLDGNFKRVYHCSSDVVIVDWKLSVLAYHLICLNGASSNPNVARMQIELLKSRAAQ